MAGSHARRGLWHAVWLLVALRSTDAANARAGGRLLHWVIRVSSLEDTLAFTSDVLNMTVLRHEENDEPCPLTCNGVFDTPCADLATRPLCHWATGQPLVHMHMCTCAHVDACASTPLCRRATGQPSACTHMCTYMLTCTQLTLDSRPGA